MRTAKAVIAAVMLGSCLLAVHVPVVSADAPSRIRIAIPHNVEIVVGSHLVVFIGKPTSTSPVNCEPGTPQPQTVVAVDPGGSFAAQITGVLAFHDHEVPSGARYRITVGPDQCNSELGLWTGTLE